MEKNCAIILSPSCGNSCLFCGSPRSKSKEEIKEEEINALKNVIDFRKQGLKGIEISGCDPIEYGKIAKLIRIIKENNFEHIMLSTHGRRLADRSFANEMIKSGVTKLRIPVYGSNSTIHDSITRASGSFEETLKGIQYILENSSIKIRISCLIVQQNKEDLVNIIDLVNSLGIKDFTFSIPCIPSDEYVSHYIPIKDLGVFIKEVEQHAAKINFPLIFIEIPFCVFGESKSRIDNKCGPPNLGKYCQPTGRYKTHIKDMPSYRLKKKVSICDHCKASGICDGFFVKDIDKFGIGDLKPV